MDSPKIQETFDLALRHHQAGRLPQAEELYRQVLSLQPNHLNAMHNLGLIATDRGRTDEAIELLRRALALKPDSAEIHNNLGIVLHTGGKLDESIAAASKAIALKPDLPEAHYNRADALKDAGRLDEAIDGYERAIALRPNYADAHNNLGNAFRVKRQIDPAIAAYRRAIALKPKFADAHFNLGNALRDKGQLDDAIAAYRRAIGFNPDHVEAHFALGAALKEPGQVDAAIAAYRRTLSLKPAFPAALNNLGVLLTGNGQLDEALALFAKAVALKPEYAEAFNNIAVVYRDQKRLDESVTTARRAIAANPEFPEAYNNLANSLRDKGQLDDAIAAYRQAISLRPSYTDAHSNLLYMLHYHPDYDARAIADEHRRFAALHAEPLRKFIKPHANNRDPDRRLRIGYVSADFCIHASAFFLVPLLENHDPAHVEYFCYSQVARPDEMTHRFQRRAAALRSTVGLSNEQIAEQIRTDRIDILVDLKLHTANNRALVFAYKPAPVQVSWLGCPASTGLTAIDYRLSDPYLDPPGMDESIYTERTFRLPDTFWCYEPLDGRNVAVNPLPAVQNGFVTFGCLNNFCKINDSVLTLWAHVLRKVENSRLHLLCPPGEHRQRTLDRLAQEGIDASRIEFIAPLLRHHYLRQYNRIDIGLDCFPYNGHTTSFDSFWMGVPVITPVGQTAVARAGLSQLSNLGLGDLAGQTPKQFVRIAVDLATDLPRLQELRGTLRARMEKSPLMDGPRFARNVESAYRQMWRTWCAAAPTPL